MKARRRPNGALKAARKPARRRALIAKAANAKAAGAIIIGVEGIATEGRGGITGIRNGVLTGVPHRGEPLSGTMVNLRKEPGEEPPS